MGQDLDRRYSRARLRILSFAVMLAVLVGCATGQPVAAAADAGTGQWPEGAAEVKEIYMAMGDATPTGGYAVSLKTSADSAEGANWYFYERTA